MTRQCLTKSSPEEYLPVWSMQTPGSVRTVTTNGREVNNWLMGEEQTFYITSVMKKTAGSHSTALSRVNPHTGKFTSHFNHSKF